MQNDWGNIAYLFGKKSDKKLDKPGTYKVRFPDGHEEEVTVVIEPHVEHINDMGNEYDVKSMVPKIFYVVHGVNVRIDPRQVEWWKS